MKINEIRVSAGRTFNHPYEQYSNLRPHVQLVATIEDSDNPEQCAKDLQAKAESLVEDHKQNMLRSLHLIREMDIRAREMARLESILKTSQEELERYRANPIKGNVPLDFFGSKPEEEGEPREIERCEDCGKFDCTC